MRRGVFLCLTHFWCQLKFQPAKAHNNNNNIKEVNEKLWWWRQRLCPEKKRSENFRLGSALSIFKFPSKVLKSVTEKPLKWSDLLIELRYPFEEKIYSNFHWGTFAILNFSRLKKRENTKCSATDLFIEILSHNPCGYHTFPPFFSSFKWMSITKKKWWMFSPHDIQFFYEHAWKDP